MRLDEWQKYIDTQFLADEPLSVQEPVSVQSKAVQAETVAKVELSPTIATIEPEITQHTVNNMLSVVVTPPLNSAATSTRNPPRIEMLTALPQPFEISDHAEASKLEIAKHSPEIANRTQRRSQSLIPKALDSAPLVEVSEGLFRPLTDLDTEIPTFQSYLPSSHAAAHPVQREDGQQAHLLTETSESEVDSNPVQTQLIEAIPLRRTPGSRAKNARNVRPETLPSALSASELWAQVPRQVQTLLSLERLEEKEVAQSSYKRQFQEKRHELIERLLDPILSLEDTARLLNVCPTTVRRYTNKGILTHYRKEPDRSARRPDLEQSQDESQLQTDKETRQRRFRLSDILIFLEAQRTAIESDSLPDIEKDI